MPILIDGKEVDSDSDEWRHQTEAQHILNLRTLAERRAWLEDIASKRGAAEADRLRQTMGRIFDARRHVVKR